MTEAIREQIEKLSTEQLGDDEIGLDGASWTEPSEFPPALQPGVQECYIDEIHAIYENDGKNTKSGKRFLGTSQTFKVKSNDRFAVSRAFVSTIIRANGHADLTDEFNSAGISAPRSYAAMGEALLEMQQAKSSVWLDLGWEGHCNGCYNAALVDLTGEASADAARERLSRMPDDKRNAIYNDAKRKRVKARSHREFPENGDHRIDTMLCKDCGGKVVARTKLVRFVEGS